MEVAFDGVVGVQLAFELCAVFGIDFGLDEVEDAGYVLIVLVVHGFADELSKAINFT